MQLAEMNEVKESLVRTKIELRTCRRASSLSRRKIDFARKITEQRMSNCLDELSPHLEDELVNLYSTLSDEDSFRLEDEKVIPVDNFLKEVELKIVERGNNPVEINRLNQVKNKILEKVKYKKVQRSRKDSTSSVSSVGSQKGVGDESLESEASRPKTEHSSRLPTLNKSN